MTRPAWASRRAPACSPPPVPRRRARKRVAAWPSRGLGTLEQLPVRGGGRLALARPWLLARAVCRGPAVRPRLQRRERRARRALDRPDAVRHPLVGPLEAMRLEVAA